MRPKILVTGANGQLGKEIRQLEGKYNGFEFVFLSREDMPIHHPELVRQVFEAYQPSYCINCAAYTAVDRAETESDLAFQVNAEAVGVLAAVCAARNCRLIHISTDYVFDGNGSRPYLPDDPTNPQSVYGASKLEGEKQAQQLNPDCIIIRTSWVYSEFGKNFVKTMLKLMKERPEISVVNDQTGSPTYAADLAEAILSIISESNWVPGVYHYSNQGSITWFDFAVAIRDRAGLSTTIHPIPSSAYPTPARRPGYSVLDLNAIRNTFRLTIRNWEEALADCIQQLPH
ncbi:MAG: dTDP-4-dehydrorhamnose reductase [Chitinophagaceae bacterium]